MAVRRLHSEQPEAFAFTPENQAWAEGQISKFPEGRQASAVIPLLWRAQEQHQGWLPEPAIRKVGEILDMPFIRVLEVATFYTMYQLQPVGKKAHIQVCGTTPCMLRGAGDIKAVCRNRIADHPHELSEDGNFSWEEVECLGACVNAPMVQIWKDTYEDLTPETFEAMLDAIAEGREITPGPQNGRHFSVPMGGPTSLDAATRDYGPKGDVPRAQLVDGAPHAIRAEAGVSINGGPQPDAATKKPKARDSGPTKTAKRPDTTSPEATGKPEDNTLRPDDVEGGVKAKKAKPAHAPAGSAKDSDPSDVPAAESLETDSNKPSMLAKPRDGGADDLKRIKGIGPKIEGILNNLGVFHFSQIADWSADNQDWVEGSLSFKGRIDREKWISQAAALAKENKG
uniref:NADH-quinone oxidoreductase subunit NuoE n=1 Tax=Pararhizobium sp. IMCC3301 TaxID=3067904 RepID=UPI002741323D|nr:NADH-quinone oxidoreductase subunit NuoE [Pararhizobium sp. IMCC3301]